MATEAPKNNVNKVTKDERKLLTAGLDMLQTSLNRSAKAAKADNIRQAYEEEAAKVNHLMIRINTGELDL